MITICKDTQLFIYQNHYCKKVTLFIPSFAVFQQKAPNMHN